MVDGPENGREHVEKHFSSTDPINFQRMFLVYAPGEGSRSHQLSLLADPELLMCGQARQHLCGTPLMGLKVREDPGPFWPDRFAFKKRFSMGRKCNPLRAC